MRYVVAHVISSPLGAVKTARLVISDVPNNTRPALVVDELTKAGRAAQYAEGGVPLGNHEVIPEGRAGWQKGLAGIDTAEVITWSRLITPPTTDDLRRVTLRLTPAQHGTYTIAATRAGVSLQQWCESALDAAAAAQLVPPLAAPAVPAAPASRPRAQAAASSSGGAE